MSKPDENSDTGQNPDHGGRCYPHDNSLTGQDHSGTDESYPGDNLANDPAWIYVITLDQMARSHKHICPETDEATGAYPCRLTRKLALESYDKPADNGRDNSLYSKWHNQTLDIQFVLLVRIFNAWVPTKTFPYYIKPRVILIELHKTLPLVNKFRFLIYESSQKKFP